MQGRFGMPAVRVSGHKGRRHLAATNQQRRDAVNILFAASVAVIVPSPGTSRRLFLDTLGLPLTQRAGDECYFNEVLEGTKHFGICWIWPLSQAAEACFGSREWPASRPVPTACIEFEVADERSVHEVAKELRSAGHELLHPVKTETWGQTVARRQTAQGVLVGISYSPWLHSKRDADYPKLEEERT
jgi:hypothetical protein